MPRHHFALIDATSRFSGADLYLLREALEANARHCADVWGLQTPGIDSISDAAHLPEWMTPVMFIDGGETTKLAAHTYDVIRGTPAIRVYAERTSGLFSGRHSMLECAGHEILEAMVNPKVDLWVQRPGHPEQQIPLECADATQDTYEYALRSGAKVQLANFVYPAWFDPSFTRDSTIVQQYKQAGKFFDHARRLRFAGELSPFGYTIVRTRAEGLGWRTWADWGSSQLDRREHAKASNARPGSRTRALGADLAES